MPSAKPTTRRKSASKTTRTTRTQAARTRKPKSAPARKGNLKQSYTDARKAFGNLWQDVAEESSIRANAIGKKIETTYAKARRRISEDDVQQALKKGKDVSAKFAKSSLGWVKQLGKQVKLLYELLRDSVGGKFNVPWATIASVTAALLYVIMPIDILPDFIPGAGLIDDAMVIALCVTMVRTDLRRYAKFRRLSLADYGL